MCLAVVGKIIAMSDNNLAKVEIMGNTKEISLCLLPGAVQGDYVLVHAGFAIGKIDEAEALATRRAWEVVRRAGEGI